MEPPSEQENKNLNIYFIFAVIIGLIILGIFYFQVFAQSPIPTEFFGKYQYQDSMVKRTVPALVFDYGAISKAIAAKDASAAADLAKKDLIQTLQNEDEMSTIQKTTTEMKLLLSQVTDATLREKISDLFTKIDERNKRMHSVISAQKNVFTVLRDHFGAAAVGAQGPALPQNIDQVIQSSQSEIQTVSQLQSSIDVAYEEIIKLAGVDPTVSQTADSIKMSLSATPMKMPTITDFPTPTPGPTLTPTATPTASPSASSEASASAQ